MNLIFGLVRIWFLPSVLPAKLKFEIDPKIKFIQILFLIASCLTTGSSDHETVYCGLLTAGQLTAMDIWLQRGIMTVGNIWVQKNMWHLTTGLLTATDMTDCQWWSNVRSPKSCSQMSHILLQTNVPCSQMSLSPSAVHSGKYVSNEMRTFFHTWIF